MFCVFVLVKYEKNKKFKTDLMTSFILLPELQDQKARVGRLKARAEAIKLHY